jgi:hypothetical protein
MDAWELLAAGSTLSDGDAWERLNALGGGSCPGEDRVIQCTTASIVISGNSVVMTRTGEAVKVGGDDVPERIEVWEYRKKKPVVVDEEPVEPVVAQVEVPAVEVVESVVDEQSVAFGATEQRESDQATIKALQEEIERLKRLAREDEELLLLLL